MPRKAGPPHLWLDKARGQWIIRDGSVRIRTGIRAADKAGAAERLRLYIGAKYKPAASPAPVIADVLLTYMDYRPQERLTIKNLEPFWSEKTTNEINKRSCREYAKTRPPVAARRDLETLRAAVNHRHGDVHPLDIRPVFELPKRPARREQWLTRSDVAKLLWAARRTPHLARFIILGFYTGSRSGAILGLKWSWVNLDARIMRRKEPGESEKRNKRRPDLRIGSRLLAHLSRWKRLDHGMEYVVHYDGDRVRKLRRSWANAAKRAGVEATPHTLRHTRATHLMQAGVSLWEAAGYLGMSTEVLEEVYGKHSPDWQKRAAEV